jgi:hypothetical protein
MVDKHKVNYLKAWLKRRRMKGIEPNANATWAKIKETWPTLPTEEWKALFQEVK